MAFDLVIRGARIVDGTGAPWVWGDLGIQGDRIAAIGHPGQLVGREVLEAEGLVLAPGFIDIQSHSILPLLEDGRSLSKLAQGVTTEIMGEGWTPAPFGGEVASPFPSGWTWLGGQVQHWLGTARSWTRFSDWLEAMEGRVSPNVGSFLAGGTLREYACGMRLGAATAQELETMRQVMAQAMQDGAFGVAYALIYPPDEFANTAEIVEVCRVAARYGGLYITHLRSEGDRLMEGLEEALQIGQQANIPVEVYHLKASGPRNWHKIPSMLARIHEARRQGIDVTADMYPYPASGTGLDAILPTWVAADGRFYDNLRDPQTRARLKAETLEGQGDMNSGRPDNIMPIGFKQPHNLHYAGMRLSQIARERGEDWVDCVINLLLDEQQRISTIYFSMTEDNLRLQVGQPWIKFSSDAGGFDPAVATTATHPRAYGTFPRVLARYVRQERLLTLEEAVAKMSGRVAQRLGIHDRGRLAPGMYADLVLFDPQTVADTATFEHPHQLPVGIPHVFVNGVPVIHNGQHTGALPGRFVRGPGAQPRN